MDEQEKNTIEEQDVIPEQLDDEDFEKEKEEEKKLKKEKRKQKREQKKSKNSEPELDEEGNVIEKKKKISSPVIVAIVIIIIAAIGVGIFLYININKPENVVKDFALYLQSENWDELRETVDLRGLYTLLYIGEENYTNFDSAYEEIVDEEGYEEYQRVLSVIEGDENTALEQYFEGTTVEIENISSVEKIENTKSLYKIKLDISFTYDSQEYSNSYEVYVAKIDGKFKIVGGYFAYLVELAYEDAYNYGV